MLPGHLVVTATEEICNNQWVHLLNNHLGQAAQFVEKLNLWFIVFHTKMLQI